MADERTVWGIHAGRTGDADTLFLKHNCVAIGWHQMSDLSALPATRDAFKATYLSTYPDKKQGNVQTNASQLFRFVHELKVGDVVAYASKLQGRIYLGDVTGNYQYNPVLHEHYPHQRTISWKNNLPRGHFSQGALYSIGSAMSFFQLTDYATEFLAALEGKKSVSVASVEKDESVAVVAERIEQNARDFVLKKLSQELKGHGFEYFVADLLRTMGYSARVSPKGADGGLDIIAHRGELGFEPPVIRVQAKSGEASIGSERVQLLSSIVAPNEYGLFVSLSKFTPAAKDFARTKNNLHLIDGDGLVDLIFQHYEELDSQYKKLLSLRRVYVPIVSDTTED